MVERRYVKNMRIGTLALVILLIFGLVSSSNVCAFDGEALGGECGICGEWVAAGEQHSCWQQSTPQPSSQGTWQPVPVVPSGPSPEELARQRRWQQQQEIMRQERLRRQKEEEARRLEEEKKRRAEFQKNKAELVSSLKGASTGGLKGTGTGSGLKIKGLKIWEVPLPSGVKKPEPRLKLKGVSDREPKPSGKKRNIIIEALIKSYEKLKQDFIDWTKTSTFEMTFGRIPGVSYAKALYDKYKEMRQEMQSLNMNIFQYAMSGIEEGIKRLATPYTSDGGFAEEYEAGRRGLFGRTFIKVRKMLKKEIDSKSQ